MIVKFPVLMINLFGLVSSEYAVVLPAIRQFCKGSQDVMIKATDSVFIVFDIVFIVRGVLGASKNVFKEKY